jgi:Sulfotransferase family
VDQYVYEIQTVGVAKRGRQSNAARTNQILAEHCETLVHARQPWGWKEPRSIFLLPFFHAQFPKMKFLHVVRDGRDMAYSSNQNQLRKHGRTLLSWWHYRLRSLPEQSLTLWSRINHITADYGETHMGANYLRLRFEDLCLEPGLSIRQIFDFFNLSGDIEKIAAEEIIPPNSLGRWKAQQNHQRFSGLEKDTLERFGYAADVNAFKTT